MDINFPLLLVIAVFGSGLIWLYDLLFIAKKRRASVAAVERQFDELSVEKKQQEGSPYQLALSKAKSEPVLVEYAKSFFPVLFIVLVLRSFLAEPFQIPSGSMIPTLKVGDFILVNKFTYGIRLPVLRNKVISINEPKRGDVMVFFPPHKPDTYYIKRVVGLPGDHIEYRDNVLYINGEAQPQQLIKALPPASPRQIWAEENLGGVKHEILKNVIPGKYSLQGSWDIPPEHYFMMGDNRDNSFDSRAWGPVHESAIVGKAFAVWMHWPSLSSIPSFDTVGTIQ